MRTVSILINYCYIFTNHLKICLVSLAKFSIVTNFALFVIIPPLCFCRPYNPWGGEDCSYLFAYSAGSRSFSSPFFNFFSFPKFASYASYLQSLGRIGRAIPYLYLVLFLYILINVCERIADIWCRSIKFNDCIRYWIVEQTYLRSYLIDIVVCWCVNIK